MNLGIPLKETKTGMVSLGLIPFRTFSAYRTSKLKWAFPRYPSPPPPGFPRQKNLLESPMPLEGILF